MTSELRKASSQAHMCVVGKCCLRVFEAKALLAHHVTYCKIHNIKQMQSSESTQCRPRSPAGTGVPFERLTDFVWLAL